MRLASVFLAALIAGASFVVTSVLPLRAVEFGTREEAVEIVRRVQEKFKKDGPEATFRAINNKYQPFIDRDLFPWVYRLEDGTNMANAMFPAVRGKHLIDLKDQNGKFITQEWIKIATTTPYHGWSDYRWPNPLTNTVEEKSSWIERMGDYLVGVGVHRNEQPNENTIGLISGSPNSDDTYLQMAYDLADVLNDDNLRIMPIAGIGGSKNIRDVRYLKGVDIGLTQTNILNNFRRSNQRMGQTDDRIVYIAKLFNEEVHLVARPEITSITQLKGLKVNFDAKGSGTSISMRDLFNTFGIEVEEVSMSQVEALEKVKSGEIAATALIAGKPVRSMSRLALGDRLHMVPIPYPAPLIGDYLPATFTHDDYPGLVRAGEIVDTVAVGAVLIAYNWPKTNVDRYRRVQKFVDAFFPKVAEFQKPPRHVKWREVNLAATLPGWNRFEAAQEWLDNERQAQQRNNPNEPFPAGQVASSQTTATRGSANRPAGASDQSLQQRVDPTLYQEFLKWRQTRGR